MISIIKYVIIAKYISAKFSAFMTKKNYKLKSAFSLIEMSMVVMIAGVLIGSGLTLFNEYSRTTKIAETEAKLESIRTALIKYGERMLYYPCPESADKLLNDVRFGFTEFDSGDCTNSADIDIKSFKDNTYQGVLPVRTLNIHPDLAFDAWGNRFNYAVLDSTLDQSGTSPLESLGTLAQIPIDNTDDILLVVFSSGDNGYKYGAYNKAGNQRLDTTNISTCEQKNVNHATYNQYCFEEGVANFDDLYIFISKNDL